MEYIGILKFYAISDKTGIYTVYYSINFLFYPLGRVCAYVQRIYSTLHRKGNSWRSTISSEAQRRWALHTGVGVLHLDSRTQGTSAAYRWTYRARAPGVCAAASLSSLTLSCYTLSSPPRDKDGYGKKFLAREEVPCSARCPCALILTLCYIQLAGPAIKWHLYS